MATTVIQFQPTKLPASLDGDFARWVISSDWFKALASRKKLSSVQEISQLAKEILDDETFDFRGAFANGVEPSIMNGEIVWPATIPLGSGMAREISSPQTKFNEAFQGEFGFSPKQFGFSPDEAIRALVKFGFPLSNLEEIANRSPDILSNTVMQVLDDAEDIFGTSDAVGGLAGEDTFTADGGGFSDETVIGGAPGMENMIGGRDLMGNIEGMARDARNSISGLSKGSFSTSLQDFAGKAALAARDFGRTNLGIGVGIAGFLSNPGLAIAGHGLKSGIAESYAKDLFGVPASQGFLETLRDIAGFGPGLDRYDAYYGPLGPGTTEKEYDREMNELYAAMAEYAKDKGIPFASVMGQRTALESAQAIKDDLLGLSGVAPSISSHQAAYAAAGPVGSDIYDYYAGGPPPGSPQAADLAQEQQRGFDPNVDEDTGLGGYGGREPGPGPGPQSYDADVDENPGDSLGGYGGDWGDF